MTNPPVARPAPERERGYYTVELTVRKYRVSSHLFEPHPSRPIHVRVTKRHVVETTGPRPMRFDRLTGEHLCPRGQLSMWFRYSLTHAALDALEAAVLARKAGTP